MKRRVEIHEVTLKRAITRSKEFERKGLATHAVNCGLLCGHDCSYCSTPALVRAHPIFQRIGKTAFAGSLSVIDPSTPSRVAKEAKRLGPGDTVMLSTITDAWAAEAKALDLGRRCLSALLEGGAAQVRLLTKNASIRDDFDLIERYRDRVTVSLSLTATPEREEVMTILEPHASPISERVAALREAAARGLRVYGMLCPCLPGIADDPGSLAALMDLVLACRAEDIWLEPVNARGSALRVTEQRLRRQGRAELADAVGAIRRRAVWSSYARRLITSAVEVARQRGRLERLHVLLYPSALTVADGDALRSLPGVIWLGR